MRVDTPGNRNLDIFQSDNPVEEDWDQFLQNIPAGEFQQSSMWARVKAVEGWQPIRWVFREKGAIQGGFQILWRKTRFGRIGYISRGPVGPDEGPGALNFVINLIIETIKQEKINALIVQYPGEVQKGLPLEKFGFLTNNLVKVVTSTIRVDVADGIQGFENRINRTKRKQIRQALRKGVSIREGHWNDIGVFFELMTATCRRQGVAPNPPTIKSFEQLWSVFSPAGCCRLTLAEYGGKPISGTLCIPFGKVVHIWKKGSFPEFLHLHPMDLLYYNILCWASQNGFEICDFEEMVDRKAAERILNGENVAHEEIHPRDIIHLRFGGKPYLLETSYLYIRNPLLRYLFSIRRGNLAFNLSKKLARSL